MKLFSLVALGAGIGCLFVGYQRQHSFMGHADNAASSIGRSFDGAPHPTRHVEYYVAGTVLVIIGVGGIGLVRR
jgi:hypothetical protein